MTRSDFVSNITTWWELLDFCSENDCDICEDIVEDEERDNEIDEDVAEAIRHENWYDIKDCLNSIPTGYEYYRRNGSFDYDVMDDYDFNTYKNDVLEWADNEGDVWDDEPEEEEEDDYDVFAEQAAVEEDDEPAPEEEDFTVGDLIGMCCVAFATIQQDDARRMAEDEQRLRKFYPKVLK